MGEVIHVNLHTHTIFSDGEQTPEALAGSLAEAGVRYAALTDHDTVEGLARFQDALEKRGIPSLAGVELTTHLDGREAHLVAGVPQLERERVPMPRSARAGGIDQPATAAVAASGMATRT